jgi:hypothetical protein
MIILQISTVALAAGLLFGCKLQKQPSTPSGADLFLAKIITELGVDGAACVVEVDGVETCVTAESGPLTANDHVDQPLMLCLRTEQGLSDCKDLREDPTLEVAYVCSNGMCHCDGIASCTLMATACGPSRGVCGECSVGDCCCLDPDVDMPD